MTTSGLFASSRPWFSRYCHRSLNIGSWLVRIDVFACQEHVVAVIVGSSSGEFVAILLGCLQFGTQLIGLVHRWRQSATILASRSLHSNDHSNCGGLVWLTYRFTWPNWSSPPPSPLHQNTNTAKQWPTQPRRSKTGWIPPTHSPIMLRCWGFVEDSGWVISCTIVIQFWYSKHVNVGWTATTMTVRLIEWSRSLQYTGIILTLHL